MLGGVRTLHVGLAAVLDHGLEREPEISCRRENARAAIAVEIGKIGEGNLRFDADLLLGSKILLPGGMDVQHQNHRGGTREFEFDIEADFDEHKVARGGCGPRKILPSGK